MLRQPPQEVTESRARRWWRRSRETRIGYAFILPVLVIFVVFRFGPTIASFVLSFWDYRLVGPSFFLGFENYERLVADSTFWTSLRVTLVYAVIKVPLLLVVSMAMAVLVNQPIRGIAVFRSIYFLPTVTSMVMVAIIWKWIYSIDGLANSALASLGLPSLPWLNSEALVLPALAIMATWKDFGFAMMVLLSGLLAIPKDYYEAAQLDGATAWQRFVDITLPLLRPVLFFVLIIESINSFQIFDAIYVMTEGGPVRASYSLVLMLYDQGFGRFDFGYASAIGVVLFVLIFIASLIQRRVVGGDT